MMTNREIDTQLKLIRNRKRVARADAAHMASQRKAEFEAQLATEFYFDDCEVWKLAHLAVQKQVDEVHLQIEAECTKLGIPNRYAPCIWVGWDSRGENAAASRRAELTRVAHTRIGQQQKRALFEIERRTAELEARLVSGKLESAEVKLVLDSPSDVGELIPGVRLEEIETQPRLLGEADEMLQ